MIKKNQKKILIFIVAYNADSHLEEVLDRIPRIFLNNHKVEILVIDDSSSDNTSFVANAYSKKNENLSIKVFRNAENQGYGGNQKIGYLYMIKNYFDIVVLLHGDGQYAPEYIPSLLEPIINHDADVVFGSRMINKREALKGGMPLYKFFGNQILTLIQNKLLGSKLSEFHSGYRVYSRKVLGGIPFQFNSNGFDFDTDIIIQIIDNNFIIKEVPIPTYYGDEICRVDGIRYAISVLKTTLLSRIQRKAQLFYSPKFDYQIDNKIYTNKVSFNSSHKFAFDLVKEKSVVLDIGCGPGVVSQELNKKSCIIYGVDEYIQKELIEACKRVQQVDLDSIKVNTIEFDEEKLDVILMLDIIEHIKKSDDFLMMMRKRFALYNPEVIITTGNIAFFLMRFSLFFGSFQYGKKGILDKTHTRLYTFSSLKRMVLDSGYIIEEVKGIPIPFPLIFGNNWFSKFLLSINNILIKINKGLFSYQIALKTRMQPSLDLLLSRSEEEGQKYQISCKANKLD
jgi:glycosyltransferase involved in cell wall biosynthesis